MAKRKALSKGARFEIFKRDGFKCVYCGRHPPDAVLVLDHVVALANGGSNEDHNLVSACDHCNTGKGARPLDAVPQSLDERAALVAEREAQLLGYQAVMEARLARIDDEMWRVVDAIMPDASEKGCPRDWCLSIKRFNEKLGVHRVLENVEIAQAAYPYKKDRTFRYFCGVCWNQIRAVDHA